MTPALQGLARGANRVLGRPLTERERDLFIKYMDLLSKWQKSHRLVGSTDPKWVVENLFLDSLIFLKVLPSPLRLLLDLGSGAGIPGLPIKIVANEASVTLVESRRRRVSFLSSAVRELGLDRVRVVAGRVEDLVGELEGRFDAVVMRCAGDVGDLLPLGARLVTPGGVVVASGPPLPQPLSLGEWVTIEGWQPGTTRRFAVYRNRRS